MPVAMKHAAAPAALAVLCATCCAPALGQSSPQTKDSAFSFTFENDLFFGTDKYYTDGVQLNVQRKAAPESAVVNRLIDAACSAFGCAADDFQHQEFKLGQLMYTPVVISSPLPQPNDRPWAGMLYVASGVDFLSANERTLTTLEAMAGIIGPYSYADQTQKWIHRTFGATPPQGWHNQIGSELGVQALVERRHAWGAWNGISQGGLQARTSYHWRAAAGTIMTFAGVGATATFGKDLPLLAARDSGGITTKASVPKDFAPVPLADTSCFVEWLRCTAFASTELRFVLRNVFLDGRAFASDPSVHKRNIVGEVSGGVRLDLPMTRSNWAGPWFVQFKATRRSPEFSTVTRASSQTFGALTAGTDF